jgi:hypothetical protein
MCVSGAGIGTEPKMWKTWAEFGLVAVGLVLIFAVSCRSEATTKPMAKGQIRVFGFVETSSLFFCVAIFLKDRGHLSQVCVTYCMFATHIIPAVALIFF